MALRPQARQKLSPLRKTLLIIVLIFGGAYAIAFIAVTLLVLMAY